MVQQSTVARQQHLQQYKTLLEECTVLNANVKQVDSIVKDVNKRRDAAVKKHGDGTDDEKFRFEMRDIEAKYDIVKDRLKIVTEKFGDLSVALMGSLKDDVRKAYIHYISLLKNLEYDMNSELSEFDKEEFSIDDIKADLGTLPAKEIKFEVSETTASDLNSSKMVQKQSLTESMINMLGFTSVDLEDDKTDAVSYYLTNRTWIQCLLPFSENLYLEKIQSSLIGKLNRRL